MPTDPPLGARVPDWRPPPLPGDLPAGRWSRLERLDADRHAALLFAAFEGHDRVWDYLPYGPFHSAAQYHRWMRGFAADPVHVAYAIADARTGRFGGVATYLRIKPEAGSIEVGNLAFAPHLQRSRVATDAMFVMMAWAFRAGYRRYEWKCNALNAASRRAAERLGLSYEGVFRQARIDKGRNRDTAWFAAIDSEWPALEEAFSLWLAPGNFDTQGGQKERLSDLTRLVLAARDPTLSA
jgi:RimJ/RimL family protein N-acetyltransferase